MMSMTAPSERVANLNASVKLCDSILEFFSHAATPSRRNSATKKSGRRQDL